MPHRPTSILNMLATARGRHFRFHRGPPLPTTTITLCTSNLNISSEAARHSLLVNIHRTCSAQGYQEYSQINCSLNHSRISTGPTCSSCLTGRLPVADASRTSSTSEKSTLLKLCHQFSRSNFCVLPLKSGKRAATNNPLSLCSQMCMSETSIKLYRK